MGRALIEHQSRAAAGILDETDRWYWTRVLNAFDMYVMKDDESVTPHLVHDGFWESWITEWLSNNIDRGTVFFDVGANTGYYSLLAYHLGALVSAYEPNPAYFEMLEATKSRLGIGARWQNHDVALSDTTGYATLHVPATLHGSASLSPMDKKWLYHEVTVRTQPLTALSGAGRYIIKVDAEGAEEKIWNGMEYHLYQRNESTTVLLEYTPGAYSDEFLDRIERYAPLRWINHHGTAEAIDREWIGRQTDWFILVLQP